MKKFLVGVLILIACSTLLISEDLNSSVGVQKDEIFLKLDTEGHTALINDIIITKSEDIISASNDKTIRVWDSTTGKEKRKILGEIEVASGEIYTIALSPNEEFLAVGGNFSNHGIRIYNYKTGKLLGVLLSHTNAVFDLDFSSDGKYLISASADSTAKIWNGDFLTSTPLDTIKFHRGYVNAVKILKKNQNYFAIIGKDKKKF